MVEECYPQTNTLYFSESSTIGNKSAAHSGGGIYAFNNTTFNFHEQLSQIKMVEEVLHRRALYSSVEAVLLETTQLHFLVEEFLDTSTLSSISVFSGNNSANNDGGGSMSSIAMSTSLKIVLSKIKQVKLLEESMQK